MLLYFRVILTTASRNDNRNLLTKIQNDTNIVSLESILTTASSSNDSRNLLTKILNYTHILSLEYILTTAISNDSSNLHTKVSKCDTDMINSEPLGSQTMLVLMRR